jgi:hypothetical protein
MAERVIASRTGQELSLLWVRSTREKGKRKKEKRKTIMIVTFDPGMMCQLAQ